MANRRFEMYEFHQILSRMRLGRQTANSPKPGLSAGSRPEKSGVLPKAMTG